ncbi:MAG TPA: hypothetical protein VMU96_02485 [Casimicrobiaceae bacterium]|nr:hypothetical protein [Casimicrobiaceae bacterium]
MNRHRSVLVVLTVWALAMIVPDFARIGRPLGSFGFYANSDGLVFDVAGPFVDEAASPARKAGLRVGDRIDLERMRCLPYDAATCGSVLAILGGLQYVIPGRVATIDVMATSDREARRVILVALERPTNWLVRIVLILNAIAGIAVVSAAARLVWTRPGPMSWGFFLYVMWFNPGQAWVFYAILQQWPLLLLAQAAAASLAQGAGYAGLLLFVMRAPGDTITLRWRPLERLLPVIAVVLALALLASYASAFGLRTETVTRAGLLAGFVVDIGAIAILLARRRKQTPEDFQRMRWVIWGCLIGLPAFIVAELLQSTTLFNTLWGGKPPPYDLLGLLYLANGVFCLFVYWAVGHARVVNVSIPLRRVTLLGLTLSIPALFLHHEAEHLQELLNLPDWAWLGMAVVILFLISRLHESAVHLADRFFNRALDRAERQLSEALLKARKPSEIDALLADEPFRRLKLASAATFRHSGAAFQRFAPGGGWDDGCARSIAVHDRLLAPLAGGKPFALDGVGDDPRLPAGLARPIFAVPAASRARSFAITFYGPHASGADLDSNEHEMLARLGSRAADSYAELEAAALRARIAELEGELAARGFGAQSGAA